MNFSEKLNLIIDKNNSLLCIGLDSEITKIPVQLQGKKNPQYEFNKKIIDATHDLVCAYKPNSAFYEAEGAKGIEQLKMTCDYLKKNYPEIVIILDAKRGDISSTNEGYVKFAFEYLQADAVTIHPYLGSEGMKPFLDQKEKGQFILCRTSNPGAGEFQNIHVDGEPLYKVVAKNVAEKWNYNQNCSLVVGATYPEELSQIRKVAPDMIFLVPGVGVQGGDLERILKAGLMKDKKGLILSASRSIIFASKDQNYLEKAREEAEKLKNEINALRLP